MVNRSRGSGHGLAGRIIGVLAAFRMLLPLGQRVYRSWGCEMKSSGSSAGAFLVLLLAFAVSLSGVLVSPASATGHRTAATRGRLSALAGLAPATFNAARAFSTGGNPQSVAIGDLNGDGKPDLVAPGGFS